MNSPLDKFRQWRLSRRLKDRCEWAAVLVLLIEGGFLDESSFKRILYSRSLFDELLKIGVIKSSGKGFYEQLPLVIDRLSVIYSSGDLSEISSLYDSFDPRFKEVIDAVKSKMEKEIETGNKGRD